MKKITCLIFTLLLGFAFFLSTGLAQTQQGAGTSKGIYLDGFGIVCVTSTETNPQLITDEVTRQIAVDVASRKIYYLSEWYPSEIRWANLNGTNSQVLITGEEIRHFTLDLPSRKIYYSDRGWDPTTDREVSSIRRANLDGSNQQTPITRVPGRIEDFAIHAAGRKIYWSTLKWDTNEDTEVSSLQRANLDGRNRETLITRVPGHIENLTLHAAIKKIYWVEHDWVTGASSIRRANLDGKSREIVVLEQANSFALDPTGRKIYWSTHSGIRRANLNGTNPQILTNGQVDAFALDLPSRKIYYSEYAWIPSLDREVSSIWLANLDGSNRQNFATVNWLGNLVIGPPPGPPAADLTGDGRVTFRDILVVGNNYGKTVAGGANRKADVNNDGTVNIKDLLFVAKSVDLATGITTVGIGEIGGFEGPVEEWVPVVGAPSALVSDTQTLRVTARDVQKWMRDAKEVNAEPEDIAVLERILAALTHTEPPPKKTALLSNYPNPFNPETWMPYQLAEPAEVTFTIYAIDGKVVRTLAFGHQPAGFYQSRSQAAYWDGRNNAGERVASGVYFYTLTARDFSATRKMLIRK